ncbi:MAG: hypothetical protein AB2718_10485, partial [Candidatus Thiodiazotropha taylori]
ALLVAHLEQPNFAPRALIGAFSGATGRIGLVLTGPSQACVKRNTLLQSNLCTSGESFFHVCCYSILSTRSNVKPAIAPSVSNHWSI